MESEWGPENEASRSVSVILGEQASGLDYGL